MGQGITGTSAPALGDLRALGAGHTVWVYEGAEKRADWARYADAIGAAVLRGADVRWVRRGA
jgi:hypothetical protein